MGLRVAANAMRQVSQPDTTSGKRCGAATMPSLRWLLRAQGRDCGTPPACTRIDIETGRVAGVHAGGPVGLARRLSSGKHLAIVEAVCSDRWVVAGDLRLDRRYAPEQSVRWIRAASISPTLNGARNRSCWSLDTAVSRSVVGVSTGIGRLHRSRGTAETGAGRPLRHRRVRPAAVIASW